MKTISDAIKYILSFEVYVMLPILMFTLSMIIGIKFKNALKYSMTLGVGFLGIFMVFDFFVSKMSPAIEAIALNTGSDMKILDVGWPPLAASSWSFSYVPLIVFLIVLVNAIMLYFKWTNTVNIDIWNYWHFIFMGQMVFYATSNAVLAIIAAIITMIIILKIGDWSAKRTEELSGIPGIAITTLSTAVNYPIALFIDNLIERIPLIRSINGNPEKLQKKLGFFGDSMFIGFLMGIGIGIAAGYSFKEIANLGISVAGVVYIIPKMSGILGEGLIPISTGAKKFILNKFSHMKDSRMGMDLAVIIGMPEAIVTGILVMPIAVILALFLPGIKFIPLGDLPNLIAGGTLIVVATRGNIFRSVIAFIPIIIGMLYSATDLSELYTKIAIDNRVLVTNVSSGITSFQDGGNVLRTYMYYLFTGNRFTLFLIPIIVMLLIFTYRQYKKDEIVIVNIKDESIEI
ncbi:PTS transporter subunit IIC [Helicovermis profundi]|uniref:PTS galactitol transporter subunit IIC n=1 Tax=Helicovermis profundi TaxID=3065157 RepID=A0AAU9EEN2_9FIRM|nr:PTS galactitol transporter subunit IIC [Clostridia bacterium S502]